MTRITIETEQAENIMFDLLEREEMGDRIYELAQDIFRRCIDVVETKYKVKNDCLDCNEEWYDGIQDTFFQAVYDRITKFMKEGE